MAVLYQNRCYIEACLNEVELNFEPYHKETCFFLCKSLRQRCVLQLRLINAFLVTCLNSKISPSF